MKSYQFDVVARACADAAINAILKKKNEIKKPVKQLIFLKDAAETIIPLQALIFYKASKSYREPDHVFDLKYSHTFIPSHIDYIKKQDRLLPELQKKFRVTAAGWSETIGLFRIMLMQEFIQSFCGVGDALIQKGIPFAKSYSTFIANPDGFTELTKNEKFYINLRTDLLKKIFSKKPKDIETFLEYCYNDASIRRNIFNTVTSS